MDSRHHAQTPHNQANHTEAPSNGDPHQGGQGIVHFMRYLAHYLAERNLTQTASSLTFTSILAMVPLLTVVLSIFTAFPIFQNFQVSLQEFLTSKLMPDAVSANVMDYLNQFAAKAASLTAIGSIFLFVTSVMLMSTIDQAFNDIWFVSEQRALGHRILVYWAIITLGPLVIGASLWASSVLARASLGYVEGLPLFTSFILTVVPILLTALAFAALFVYVPNRKVLWRDALIGGLLTAVVLELLRVGFAFYITQFPTYTLIYGAFATVPIFLLWVYISWLVVLSGATLVAMMPNIRHKYWHQTHYTGYQFSCALQILAHLWRAQNNQEIGYSCDTLSRLLQRDSQTIESILGALKSIGFVVNTVVEGEEQWVLACNPSRETIGPVVDLFILDRKSVCDELSQPLVEKLNKALDNHNDFKLITLFQQTNKTTQAVSEQTPNT